MDIFSKKYLNYVSIVRIIFPFIFILLSALALTVGNLWGHELRSQVPNYYEEEAFSLGKQFDIGSAHLVGPSKVEVDSYQTFTLVYTAGKAGIKRGGGLRIGFRHLARWTKPQIYDPLAAGYLTALAENGQPLRIQIDFGKKYFSQYFPWQNMVEVVFPESGLQPNETVKIIFGDTSGGGPGIRVQPFDESHFIFKSYIDALGDGKYLPLEASPFVEVVPAEPFRLKMVMPSDAVVGEPTWVIVRAEDKFGNPALSYRGTVTLESVDSDSLVPQTHSFLEEDQGVFRFEKVFFTKEGIQKLTASDQYFTAIGNPVRVMQERPTKLLLWGDLHGHTLMSDGRGTVEQFYDFAERVAGLDVCAVTDHAFEVLDEMWEHSKRVTSDVYKPGKFVSLQAYEWSGLTPLGGDHNCYFLSDNPPLYRSSSYYSSDNLQMYHGSNPKKEHINDVFEALKKHFKNKDVFCIPHWGGRPGNPDWHDSKVQRLVEVFSEHRRSEEWAGDFLERGHRLGVMASTDGHYGNPGYGYLIPSHNWDQQEIGMAATAIYASDRTREAVFDALYNRNVYATTGDRILLDFRVNGHLMGAEILSETNPILFVDVVGSAPIDLIEIKKGKQTVYSVQNQGAAGQIQWSDSDFKKGESCYYYVRIVQKNGEIAISSPVWVN